MDRSHVTLQGDWVDCEAEQTCPLPLHVDLSAEAATALPSSFIERLAEAFDPPTGTDEYGDRYWLNAAGELHRDYDLPAVITPDGVREWCQHGESKRFGDRPEFENELGDKAWMDGRKS
jgi:hypothetical protein